jgi:hypothetical protein
MVLTVSSALSPATNSSCHRRWQIWLVRARSGRLNLRQLGISNGCQNHTASPYAATSFVCAPFDRSRVWLNPKPALQFTCAPNAAASTASNPASMTMANAPLWDRTAEFLKVFRVNRQEEYFPLKGWTRGLDGFAVICPSGKARDDKRRVRPGGLATALMVRRRSCAVSNHERTPPILRDAGAPPLLGMRWSYPNRQPTSAAKLW